jgi:purine-binding chemotaxis protein CheW
MSHDTAITDSLDDSTVEFVTVRIAGQLFGLPIHEVEDVFVPQNITSVPLSTHEVAGVLNLRGRIVTAINMRERLQLEPLAAGESSMAVGIEHNGESYGLVIDTVGEVLRLKEDGVEPNPTNLNPNWTSVSAGVYQLDGELMVVLDVARVLLIGGKLEQLAGQQLGVAV